MVRKFGEVWGYDPLNADMPHLWMSLGIDIADFHEWVFAFNDDDDHRIAAFSKDKEDVRIDDALR